MLFSDTLTVTRYAAQTRGSDGRVSAASAASTFSISASVQRPDARSLKKLMEGGHTDDAWHVDTWTALQGEDELAGTPADTTVIDGNTYEVFKVTHVRSVLPHYETLMRRVETGRQP